MKQERSSIDSGLGVRSPAVLAANLAVVLICVAGSAPLERDASSAEPSPAKSSAPEEAAAKLVEKLSSDDFKTREAAHKALLEMGESAREALRSAADSEDVEQRLRARSILDELARRDLWEPSRVTLHVRESPVLDVFREIERQTGNPVNWDRSPRSIDRRISIDFDKRTYWEAMDEVTRAGQVAPRPYDDVHLGGVVLTHGFLGKYPVSYQGPLRLRWTNYHRALSQTINFGDGVMDHQDSVTVNFELSWEQRLALCRYTGWPKILEAKTDAGEDLKLELKQRNALMHLARRQRQLTFSSRLRPPRLAAARLEKLRVAFDLVAAGDYQTLAIDSLAEGQIVAREGYELELLSVQEDMSRFEIKLRWSRPAPYDKMNSIEMVDEYLEVYGAGGKLLPVQLQQVHGDRNGARYSVVLPVKHGKPLSLAYKVARLQSRRTVEFSFQDVPLPPISP